MTLGLSLESPSPRDTCPPLILMQIIHSVWGQASPVMQGACVCVCVCVVEHKPQFKALYLCAVESRCSAHTNFHTRIHCYKRTRLSWLWFPSGLSWGLWVALLQPFTHPPDVFTNCAICSKFFASTLCRLGAGGVPFNSNFVKTFVLLKDFTLYQILSFISWDNYTLTF